MKKHKVEITETLQRTIVVEAETEDEAIEIVRTKYETSEITLNSDDHIDTEITTLTPFPVFKIGDKVKFTELQTVLDYLLNEFKEEKKRTRSYYHWESGKTITEPANERHARLSRLRKEINVVLKKMGG